MRIMLGPLVLFAAAMCLTPGPNVIMVTASAANFGFRRTIPQMLGITFGFGLMILAMGFGLAGMVHAEPRLLLRQCGQLMAFPEILHGQESNPVDPTIWHVSA
jgi:threonine/homoserine/homoserine lactone efflux protein